MATNLVHDGDRIPLVAPAGGVVSGQGLLVGAIFGVVMANAAAAATCVVAVRGVYTLPKATGAVTQGQRLFWDDTAKNVTTTSTGNFNIGRAAAAQLSGDATVNVLLGATTPAGT